MAWYYGKFSCGCEGRTNIVGPTKNREWIAEQRFTNLCEDCNAKRYEEEKQAQTEAARVKAAEMELPELTGSEKQIAWALVLRQKLIDLVGADVTKLESLAQALECDSAKVYIDYRYDLSALLKPVMPCSTEQLFEKDIQQEVEASIIYPEGMTTGTPATIEVSFSQISITFERNEAFIKLVKSLGYEWSGKRWVKSLDEFTGSPQERSIELAHKVLTLGIPVAGLNTEDAERAIDADYQEECTRWVKRRSESTVVLVWKERNDKLYNAARKLPGSKWRAGVVIDATKYAEVRDFANIMGFKISEQADTLMTITEAAILAAVVKKVSKKAVKKIANGLDSVLESSREVIDDLKD